FGDVELQFDPHQKRMEMRYDEEIVWMVQDTSWGYNEMKFVVDVPSVMKGIDIDGNLNVHNGNSAFETITCTDIKTDDINSENIKVSDLTVQRKASIDTLEYIYSIKLILLDLISLHLIF